MITKSKNEYSPELRALALRFFSFTDKYQANRTQKYMELSTILKDQSDLIEEMLKTMRSCKPFNSFPDVEQQQFAAVNEVRKQLNNFSSESLFLFWRNKAILESYWERKHNVLPNAEAAAWLAYFCDFDPKKDRGYGSTGDYVANNNWHTYYKEYFSAAAKSTTKPLVKKTITKKANPKKL